MSDLVPLKPADVLSGCSSRLGLAMVELLVKRKFMVFARAHGNRR